MKSRQLLFIFIVFFIIASFYVVYEMIYVPGREEERLREAQVFKVGESEIDFIRLVRGEGGGDEVFLERTEGGKWIMTSPVRTGTDSAEVATFIYNALDAKRKRELGTPDDLGAGLSRYGLEEPYLIITLGSQDNSHTLHLGAITPDGNHVYARMDDDDDIFLVYDIVLIDLDRDAYVLRDKGLVAFSPEVTHELSITSGDETINIVRSDGDKWDIVTPIEFPADVKRVEDLLSLISRSFALSFIDEEIGDLKDYGLDKPDISLTLTDEGGETSTLLIGAQDENGDYFAMREGGSLFLDKQILTVSESLKDDLDLDPESLMDKVIMTYSVGEVTNFTLTTRDETIKAKRDKDNWRIMEPEELKGDRTAIEELLWGFRELRFDEIVESPARNLKNYGLDDPEITFTVSYDHGGETFDREFSIGESKKGARYLFVPDYLAGEDFIFILTSEGVEDFSPGLFDLKDKSLITLGPEEIFSITVKWANDTYEFTRDGDPWEMTAPEGTEVESEDMKYFLIGIGDVSYFDVLKEGKGEIGDFGLDTPYISITLKDKDGAVIGRLEMGEADEELSYLPGISSEKADIYAIDPELINDLKFDLEYIIK